MCSSDPLELLRRHFGYPGFRPGQEELVRAVLAGRDALGVLPTGGGKSVCYQVPALALGGLTLVVTPLVSLMEDQVRRAREVGLSGRLPERWARRRRCAAGSSRAARAGGLDALFVAPERLGVPSFQEALAAPDVRLLAVDEAHCISEWGHDFRPAYRRIGSSATDSRLPCWRSRPPPPRASAKTSGRASASPTRCAWSAPSTAPTCRGRCTPAGRCPTGPVGRIACSAGCRARPSCTRPPGRRSSTCATFWQDSAP